MYDDCVVHFNIGEYIQKKIFLSASMMFILSFTLLAFIIDFFYAIFNGTEISYPLYKLHIILVIFILSNLNFSDDFFMQILANY